ncbi:MAG TPA: DUF4173 domain-containing protein [Candidatus Limnocylindrales bacterium]|jgi:hypothetical protein
MDRPMIARTLVALALALGALAQLLFYRLAPGISVPIFTVAALVAAWLVRPDDARFDPLDRWLPPLAVGLAALVAFRADPTLVFVNTAGAFTALGFSAAALTGIAVTRRTGEAIIGLGIVIGGTVFAGAALALTEMGAELRVAGMPRVPTQTGAAVRGLFIAAPIVLVFAFLFSSADAVFSRWLDMAINVELGVDVWDRILLGVFVAWFAAGLLFFAARGQAPEQIRVSAPAVDGAEAADTAAATAEPPPRVGGLGVTEAIVVLVVVDLLFGVFIVLQLAYLFGGMDTLAAAGTTYAEYGRRGFFELLFAAGLAGVLVAGLESIVARRTRPYLAASLVLVGLTAAVLVSALQRMRLYQEAYGWTELRFWALAGIVFVGIALGATAVVLVRNRTSRLPHALAAILVGVLGVVNVVGPQAFVADRNLERIFDPSLIPPDGRHAPDIALLAGLGDDAAPSLVAALPRLPEQERRFLLSSLRERAARLARDPGLTGWPAWNLGRQRARDALAQLSPE